MIDEGSQREVLGEGPPLDELALELAERRVMARVLGQQLQPLRVARFALEHELGSGGMGMVWLAEDEQLGRRVAIKFLRSDRRGESAKRRFVEEARALAKLSHPNVIPVYDSGVDAGRTWIAMEFVPGRTLREWVAAERPSAAQILARWIEAGRGLAAVHAAGLVHRDVKPDNVLLGDDGRVRVIDFGLVRAPGLGSTDAGSRGSGRGEAGDRSEQGETRTGQFVGTRAYAAPEQLAGAQVGPLADQFAFCVSVWEGLCGARPRSSELPQSAGELLPLAKGVRMSRQVHRGLSRGLCAVAELRHPDMDALLEALAPRRRRWPLVAGLAAASFVGIALGVGLGPEAAEPAPACAQAGAAIEASWTEARRDEVLAEVEPSRRAGLAAALDDWAARWHEAATQSCSEVHIEQLRSPASLDRRGACLGRQLDRFAWVTAALAAAPERTSQHVRLLATLGDPRACLAQSVLDRGPESRTPVELEQAQDLRARLFRAAEGLDGVDYGARQASAEALLAEAKRAGLVEVEAEIHQVLARLARAQGDAKTSLHHDGMLLDLGEQLDDPELRQLAWHGLGLLANDLDFDSERAAWAEARQRSSLREQGDPPLGLGRLALLRSVRLLVEERLDEAETQAELALEQFTLVGSSQANNQARALRILARVHGIRGEHEQAEDAQRRARARATLREDGPSTLKSRELYDKAEVELQAGNYPRAQQTLAEGLALAEREAGEGPAVADFHLAHVWLYDATGQLDAARQHAYEAERIYTEIGGGVSIDRLFVLQALGLVEYRARDWTASVEAYARALELAELLERVGPLERARARANLGEALLAAGLGPRARIELERAQAVLLAAKAEPAALATTTKALALALLEAGQPESARVQIEQALALFAGPAHYPLEHAEAQWVHARVLDALELPAEGLAAGRAAEAQFLALPSPPKDRVLALSRWIAAREPGQKP